MKCMPKTEKQTDDLNFAAQTCIFYTFKTALRLIKHSPHATVMPAEYQ
jgi:hypothetical protein